jgi:hypothetical protein
MNKKSFFIFLIMAAIFASFTQNALADFYAATVGSSYGPYHAGNGGEFTLQANNALASVLAGYSTEKDTIRTGTNVTFQTFCLERNEYIYSPGSYKAVLNNGSMAGGVGGAIHEIDPISKGTAWLYSQFAAGTLLGYNYTTTGRLESAAALQNTIWWLEDELTDQPVNIFSAAVIGMFGADAKADNNGAASNGGVYVGVLNLTDSYGHRYQDQLVVTNTPIPAAIWLFGAGLVGVFGVRRRFTT